MSAHKDMPIELISMVYKKKVIRPMALTLHPLTCPQTLPPHSNGGISLCAFEGLGALGVDLT